MLNRKGLTLIEIIIAIALIGILSIGIIPAFSSQFLIMNRAKDITADAFNAQGLLEDSINDARNRLKEAVIDFDAVTEYALVENIDFLGKTVDLHRLEFSYPVSNVKSVRVYLSELMAKRETQSLLSVSNVQILVDGVYNNIAQLTDDPELSASHDDNSDGTLFYANLYQWWVSQRGVASPRFPDDYSQILVPNTQTELNDLLNLIGANRYVELVVTPVDIHGRSGNTQRSNNPVFVEGQEWRSGIFAWIDKDNNENLDPDDIQLKDNANNVIKLKEPAGFDSGVVFIHPDTNDSVDPSDGALYVPMRVGGSTSALTVSGTENLNWTIDKSIHIAKSFSVSDSKDIQMIARDGNIIFYRYIQLDGDGNPVKVGGVVQMANAGPYLETDGNIQLRSNNGLIGINEYAFLEADSINLAATGRIYVHGVAGHTSLDADRTISMDTTINIGTTTVRDITFNKATIEMGSGTSEFKSGHGSTILFDESNVVGTGSILLLNPANNLTTYKGGGWNTGTTLRVPDGKIILLEAKAGRVNNAGSLDLGNTGSVSFKTSMNTDLTNHLGLILQKGDADNEVRISTSKYTRNIGYASSNSTPVTVSSPGAWQNMGSGQSNFEFTANRVAGSGGIDSLEYSFDGTNKIIITGEASEAVATTVELKVRDKHSSNAIVGAVNFTFTATEPGEATIVVGEMITADIVNIVDSRVVSGVVEVTVPYDTPLAGAISALGSSIRVSLSNGTETDVPVSWINNSSPAYSGTTIGLPFSFESSFHLPTGITNNSNIAAPSGLVHVDNKPTKDIVSFETIIVNIPTGTPVQDAVAKLGSMITVTLDDSSVISVPVVWDNNSAGYTPGNGIYTFTGSFGSLPEGVSNGNNIVPSGTVNVRARDVIWSENFNNPVNPQGWDFIGTDNWTRPSSSLAGGSAPELRFSRSTPNTNITSRAQTMIINTSDYEYLELSFRDRVDYRNNSFNIRFMISTDGGINWSTLREETVTSHIAARNSTFDIRNYDGNDIMISWLYQGGSNRINYWVIDDVFLRGIPAN